LSILLRPIQFDDLEVACRILASAFQRPGGWLNDLRFTLEAQPNGYFLACESGEPVGMVGAIIYSTFSYVGLMAVHPEKQRQGIGLALMQHLLAWLDQKQVPLVLLDASPAGQPLYERLGFVPYDTAEIFQRVDGPQIFSRPKRLRPISAYDLELLTAIDTNAFGADRSRILRALLEAYPDRAFLLPDDVGQITGYLFARENRIGPWVCYKEEDAEVLLQAALSLPFTAPVSVAVPGENLHARVLLQRYGFELVRINRHMGRGCGAPAGQRGKIYGQTSLSLG
jgi:predicted N-acetyltransferase YhbS